MARLLNVGTLMLASTPRRTVNSCQYLERHLVTNLIDSHKMVRSKRTANGVTDCVLNTIQIV